MTEMLSNTLSKMQMYHVWYARQILSCHKTAYAELLRTFLCDRPRQPRFRPPPSQYKIYGKEI